MRTNYNTTQRGTNLIAYDPLKLVVRRSERTCNFIQAIGTVQAREQRGNQYIWAYPQNSYYDQRVTDVDILVFNRDVFCKDNIHIPAIINMKRPESNSGSQAFPVHFLITQDDTSGSLTVDVDIEPLRTNSSISPMATLQACLETIITTDEATQNTTLNETSVTPNYQDGILIKDNSGDGDILHYTFNINGDIFNRPSAGQSIGFKFNWHDQQHDRWSITPTPRGPCNWILKGEASPGMRNSILAANWKSVTETHPLPADTDTYGKINRYAQAFTGSMTFTISEDDCGTNLKEHKTTCRVSIANNKIGNAVTSAYLITNDNAVTAPKNKTLRDLSDKCKRVFKAMS
ncbi:MAG: hypothetical protein QS748_02825 [Candidatus Endonucleobacter bathymodioli]|uniref:Uncharacterized protein n=1 Tax=Candidatus Endonucleibacter bathymodioli TaxID=539814 RepID=A0AA90SS97_9GAMM|nr:hypothetical protein [Candidatus Endonucleobacter bathymodioli]